MINLNYLENGKIKTIPYSTNIKSKAFWIDLLNPTPQEIQIISKDFNIDESDLSRSIDDNEKPVLITLKNYTQLTFSIPAINDESKRVINPTSFFLNNKIIISIRKRDAESFKRVYKKLSEQGKPILKHPFHLASAILEAALNDYFDINTKLDEQINSVEDMLFKKIDEKKLMKRIFELKRKLMYLHKSLTQNREVLLLINRDYIKTITFEDTNRFRYILMDTDQLIEMFSSQREVVTELVEIYVSNISNNLNEVMKKLTVYASYILIPTLIASIYGMNFRFMPWEASWEYGFFLSLFSMVASVIVLHVLFRRKGWI